MSITEEARNKLSEILSENPDKVFRVGLQGGGCNGFQYLLMLDDAPAEDDILVEKIDGHQIIIDPMSAMYLDESVLDYKSELFSQAFVINNPNVTGTCGCGSSMSF
jgi:iron-sulfur cluster insertion protein